MDAQTIFRNNFLSQRLNAPNIESSGSIEQLSRADINL
jgi:hypothetical protein